jgi:hypothetical protein
VRCDPDEVLWGQLHTRRAETFRVRLRSGSNGTGVNNSVNGSRGSTIRGSVSRRRKQTSGTQASWQIIFTEANLLGRGTARLQDGAALLRRTPLSVLVYRFRAGGIDRLVANVIRNGERAVLVLHTREEKCAERSDEDIRVRMCVGLASFCPDKVSTGRRGKGENPEGRAKPAPAQKSGCAGCGS